MIVGTVGFPSTKITLILFCVLSARKTGSEPRYHYLSPVHVASHDVRSSFTDLYLKSFALNGASRRLQFSSSVLPFVSCSSVGSQG